MHTYKSSSLVLLLAAALIFGNSICMAEEPEAAARQAQVDADLAKAKIRDLKAAERGSEATQDIDTAERLGDNAKIQKQEHKVYKDEEAEGAAEEEEYSDEE